MTIRTRATTHRAARSSSRSSTARRMGGQISSISRPGGSPTPVSSKGKLLFFPLFLLEKTARTFGCVMSLGALDTDSTVSIF